jgi:hypothetical protein
MRLKKTKGAICGPQCLFCLQIITENGGNEEGNREQSGDNGHDLIGASLLSTSEDVHLVATHNGSGCTFGFTRLEQSDDYHNKR